MEYTSDNANMGGTVKTQECESIHSGQFMVSHFEAEEAQDDLLDDSEVKMLDPEDPNLSKPEYDEPNPCREVKLYVPRKIIQHDTGGASCLGLVTSHLEIETSLTKLFKCMTLAYSQKLTSPKWNHFKGVRLRWKDKIRLNNVIWRCWHMQFILKRKTPVCQFASPLDTDVHNNPQNVVLEGKYWKRQLIVIKAEYRKWRKNSKTKATGCLTYDTKSELDILDWSPLNDRSFMLPEDWTSDTLFSAINGPFPFPDPREIARGAGIADFIQPSLGPLQPNLDDIDVNFTDLLQSARLPPVPEEGGDDIIKNVDYEFPEIMVSSNDMDTTTTANAQIQNVSDSASAASIMNINAPLTNMQYVNMEAQFAIRPAENIAGTLVNNIVSNSATENEAIQRSMMDTVMGGDHDDQGMAALLTKDMSGPTGSPSAAVKHFVPTADNIGAASRQNEFLGKSVIKGRVSKSFTRPFRREPHNYDKAQPTLHQTTIYNKFLAEQQLQQQQHNLQSSIVQQQQQQQRSSYGQTQFPQAPGLYGNDNYAGYSATPNGPISSGVPESARVANNLNLIQNLQAVAAQVATTSRNQTSSSTTDIMNMLNMQNTNNVTSAYLSTTNAYGSSKANDVAQSSTIPPYKSYQNTANFKKSSSTGMYINAREMQTPEEQNFVSQTFPQPASQQMQQSMNFPEQMVQLVQQQTPLASPQLAAATTQLDPQQQQQQQLRTPPAQATLPREMFRSNSLPLNVSLQKLVDQRGGGHGSHDNFVMPKYLNGKTGKYRTRSNSIHHQFTNNALGTNAKAVGGGNAMAKAVMDGGDNLPNLFITEQLQSATSDPMLNNTLSQMLTGMSDKQQSSSTSALGTLNMGLNIKSDVRTLKRPEFQENSPLTMNQAYAQIIKQKSGGSLVTPSTVAEMERQNVIPMQQHRSQLTQSKSKSPKKSRSLPVPVVPVIVSNPPVKTVSFPPVASSSPATTAEMVHENTFPEQDLPLSPTNSSKFPRDQRRAGHIHAEQKRRCNIKTGFDMLHSLIPQLQQNPNAKLSKAAMLQKGADHIRQLRSERAQLEEKMDVLRKERETLNNALTHLHSILPANGAPVTRQGTEHIRQLYDQYVAYRTRDNWKFWILGLILEPLLASYTSTVSSASMDELRRTAFLWIDQHCSLIDLRPAVSNKLKYLSMKTDILSEPPSTLQDEVSKAIHNDIGKHPNLHGL